MKQIRVIGTAEHGIPSSMVKAEDFGDDKKDGMVVFATADGEPVILRRSAALIPMPWCVHRGVSTVFFATYKDATNYCKQRGYSPVYGGK